MLALVPVLEHLSISVTPGLVYCQTDGSLRNPVVRAKGALVRTFTIPCLKAHLNTSCFVSQQLQDRALECIPMFP